VPAAYTYVSMCNKIRVLAFVSLGGSHPQVMQWFRDGGDKMFQGRPVLTSVAGDMKILCVACFIINAQRVAQMNGWFESLSVTDQS
jgi:hypothetical protein